MPDPIRQTRVPYFGDFVLIGEIGRGASGVVFDAHQTSLGRKVALKVLHAEFSATEAAAQRLRIEAEAVAKLNHPGIVPIYEIGEHEGRHYLAMQLIEGESLAENLQRPAGLWEEHAAARLLAKIALAVHHAHQRGVLHRDLKPGNILLDEAGEPHLIDFGIAKCLGSDASMTQTGAFMGTPAYASPEQASGGTKFLTTASDVYGLGAVLHAVLTGLPPVTGDSVGETLDKARHAPPADPSRSRPDLSRNLAAICLKCLARSPEDRYPSAQALAEDLENHLAGLWAAAGAGLICGAVAFFAWRDLASREAEAHRQTQQRRLIEEIQGIRLTTHAGGWFDRAWAKAREAAAIPTASSIGDIRDQAAALLEGLDARAEAYVTNTDAVTLAFNPGTGALWMGGRGDGPRLWAPGGQTVPSGAAGTNTGPVAFTPDGKAVQLIHGAGRGSFTLVDALDSRALREWRVAEGLGGSVLGDGPPTFEALSRDGSVGAAVLPGADGAEALVALLPEGVRLLGTLPARTTALSLSPDGSLAAAAFATNQVVVYALPTGVAVAEFTAGRNLVLSLGFGRTKSAAGREGPAASERWVLGVGDDGGAAGVWDIESRTLTARCRGAHHRVDALCFSPDGALLATGGRGPLKLYDARTGRHLLDLTPADYLHSLDFSADGSRLAAGYGEPNQAGVVTVWKLDPARGLRTLRGLDAQIAKVCFSRDGSLVAALSQRWELGVWETKSGRFVRRLEAPEGRYSDNAALAFSPDGRRLAFSAGSAARLWEVSSGRELASWRLPAGLADTLAFTGESELTLLRAESEGPAGGPAGDSGTKAPGVVCRVRHLLGPEPMIPRLEIGEFDDVVHTAHLTPDARWLVIEGVSTTPAGRVGSTSCFDAVTGRRIWSIPSQRVLGSGVLRCDNRGERAAVFTERWRETAVVDISSGRILRTQGAHPTVFSVDPPLTVEMRVVEPLSGIYRGFELHRDPGDGPTLALGLDADTTPAIRLHTDGNLLAWGSQDGTVTLCDLAEVRSRLRAAGLGW